MVIEILRRYIFPVTAVFFPLLFVYVDWMLKSERGKMDVNFLGADACLAGCSLFVGSFLGKILSGSFKDHLLITACVLLGFILFIIWWSCIALGCKTFPIRKGSNRQPHISLLIGGISLYTSVISSWKIIL